MDHAKCLPQNFVSSLHPICEIDITEGSVKCFKTMPNFSLLYFYLRCCIFSYICIRNAAASDDLCSEMYRSLEILPSQSDFSVVLIPTSDSLTQRSTDDVTLPAEKTQAVLCDLHDSTFLAELPSPTQGGLFVSPTHAVWRK